MKPSNHTVSDLRALGRATHATVLTMLLVVCAALLARLYRLEERSIWFDEASSWRTSQFPLPQMMSRIVSNNHPPFFYLCLKAWTTIFGDSLLSLRGMSVILSSTVVLGVFLFGRDAYREENCTSRQSYIWIGVLAAIILAGSTFQIRMAWEARMYALGAALSIFSSWLLIRAWQSYSSPRLWASYSLLTLLLAYTHYYGLFVIFGQLVFVIWEHYCGGSTTGTRLRCALAAFACVAIGWMPWLPIFLLQRGQIESRWWTGTFHFSSIWQVIGSITLGDGLPNVIKISCSALVALAVMSLLVRPLAADRLLFSIITSSFGLAIVYSYFGRNIFIDRYFTFTHVFIAIVLARVVCRITNRTMRICATVWLVINLALLFVMLHRRLEIPNRPGMHGAAQWIDSMRQPSEPVLATSPMIYYPLLYHLADKKTCYLLAEYAALAPHEGGAFAKPTDCISQEQLAALQGGRIWLVTGGWRGKPIEPPLNWKMLEERSFQEVYEFQGLITVQEFRIDTDGS